MTYADYLATVRQQEARDRDRFTGAGSHDGEPMYSAETGAERSALGLHATPSGLITISVPISQELLDDMIAAWRDTKRFLEAEIATIFGVPVWMLEDEVIDGRSLGWASQPFGVLPAGDAAKVRTCKPKPPRHTYPKPHREWWRR